MELGFSLQLDKAHTKTSITLKAGYNNNADKNGQNLSCHPDRQKRSSNFLMDVLI